MKASQPLSSSDRHTHAHSLSDYSLPISVWVFGFWVSNSSALRGPRLSLSDSWKMQGIHLHPFPLHGIDTGASSAISIVSFRVLPDSQQCRMSFRLPSCFSLERYRGNDRIGIESSEKHECLIVSVATLYSVVISFDSICRDKLLESPLCICLCAMFVTCKMFHIDRSGSTFIFHQQRFRPS